MNKQNKLKNIWNQDILFKTPIKRKIKNKDENKKIKNNMNKKTNKKKVKITFIYLLNKNENKKYKFPLLNEEELNIPKNIQNNLKNNNIDEDVDTDEEVLKYSSNFCKEELLKDLKNKKQETDKIIETEEKFKFSFSILSKDRELFEFSKEIVK